MTHGSTEHVDLNTITPPTDLTEADRLSLFEHFFRRLTVHRNQFQLYALAEAGYIQEDGGTSHEKEILKELDHWGQELLQNAWTSCHEPGGGRVSFYMCIGGYTNFHLRKMPAARSIQ
jgi:hypothetical protein